MKVKSLRPAVYQRDLAGSSRAVHLAAPGPQPSVKAPRPRRVAVTSVRKSGQTGSEKQRASSSANPVKALEGRALRLGMIRLGSGPWRILPNCPAIAGHNTVAAARAPGALALRCRCPRALELLEQYQRDEKARRVARGGSRGARQRKKGAAIVTLQDRIPGLLGRVLPEKVNLKGGACRTEAGQRASDAAFGTDRGVKAGAIHTMRKICNACPVRDVCGAMAVQREIRPGEWGGMYGGLSVADRVNIGKLRAVKS